MIRGREAKEAMNIPGNQHVPMVPGVPDFSNYMPNVPDVPNFSDLMPKVPNGPMNFSDDKNLLDMLKGKYNRPAYIVVLLITSLVLVAVLIMFGSYRRQSHQMLLKLALLGSYSLHLYIISNTLGLMQSPPYKIELYAIWAVLWLLIHETASSTLSKLRDTQNGVSKLLQDIFLLYLVCWVYYVHHNQSWWTGPLALVLLFSVLKCGVRLIRSALTSLHLCHSVSLETRTILITDFMRYEDKLSSNGEEIDPVNMQGYKYLVKGEERLNMEMAHPPNKMEIDDGVITIEKVFQCKEKLLKSDGGDPSGHLKDMCLSFALFRMLMRRFRGHPLHECGLPKTWKFVHRGLLSKTDRDHERAYRVIEVELSFLYDCFYSNYPVIFSDRILFLGGTVIYMIKEIVKFSAGLLIAEQLMKLNSNFEKYDSSPLFCKSNQFMAMPPMSMPPSMQRQMNDIQKNIDDMQKSIQDSICGEILSNLPGKNHVLGTFVVIGLFFFLQILQFLTFVFSDWTKVSLLCKHVQKPCWLRIKIFKWASEFICRHQFIKMKPWRKKMGQYDLLSSFNYNPISFFLFCACADMTKRGQKDSDFIELHPDVKRAVLNPLMLDDPQLENRQLTNGVSSLQQNKVDQALSWACELETNTHTILVWHIATTLCEMENTLDCKAMDSGEKKSKPGIQTSSSDENDSCEEEQNRRIATSLSGYCAYLVASVPALLPDPTDTTEAVFDKTILQARELLEECATVADRYKKLREIKDSSNIIKKGAKMEIKDSSNIIKMGAEIQNQLLSLFPVERSRWKVLAEFWVELMLFLAPSDNAMAHAENLANGGEFITHLWALLTHAGIIERNSSLQHDEENQNSAS
ncbi:uncharacterized protein LOC131220078 [Magnolia sinica]|uniref:uncharacterized protein LOC131220078 n=1 Tax=Magnolia sinica TaxID=86752 RepID=UPI0026598E01|nr:uncharacterized protein LOC131220078 [Magnolia sinica]